jgi:Protein of unknown function (DUF1566)
MPARSSVTLVTGRLRSLASLASAAAAVLIATAAPAKETPEQACQKGRSAAACDADRFADNGDGTVTDRLTGLQWEQKTDGGAFTELLAALNTAECFAGHCDWRLPTRAELPTILAGSFFACALDPCIDETLFGPTTTVYWTATESPFLPGSAWAVGFGTAGVADGGAKNGPILVRAIRGGL